MSLKKERRQKTVICPFCEGPLSKRAIGGYVYIECTPCKIIVDGYSKKRADDWKKEE